MQSEHDEAPVKVVMLMDSVLVDRIDAYGSQVGIKRRSEMIRSLVVRALEGSVAPQGSAPLRALGVAHYRPRPSPAHSPTRYSMWRSIEVTRMTRTRPSRRTVTSMTSPARLAQSCW